MASDGDKPGEPGTFLDPAEARPPSPTEIAPPPAPEGDGENGSGWQSGLDAGRERGPTSAHEAEGWRDLKLF